MQPPTDDSHAALRRAVYVLLIVCSTAAMVGRVWTVRSASGKTAMLSANDRSRWCTIRALVDHGTFRIDQIVFQADGRTRDREWQTIDMVRHAGWDGYPHYYSSKPTLLPTLLAGKYWLFKTATGATLAGQTRYVQRLMILTTNVLPLVVYFLLLAVLIERLGTTDWGRLLVMAAATWGTFLTTFAVTINNHLPAAISALIAVFAALPILRDSRREYRYFVLVGLFSAFAAANELPALSLFAVLTAACLWRAPWQSCMALLPAAAVVAAGFFVTNYVAHDSWKPAYAHRQAGDNWYDYEGTYWTPDRKTGVDRGEPSPAVYAFHVLLGHRGIFSLTPLWLFSLAGIAIWVRGSDAALRNLALMVFGLTVICLAFYISRPLEDRNYGGVAAGFRWMFWFIPLWLICLIPAADAAAGRPALRRLAWVLLFVSVVSASYANLNPWSHSWLFDYWTAMGWIQY